MSYKKMCKNVIVIMLTVVALNANDINLLNEISYESDGYYNMVIEIPAGSNKKYEINKKSGKIEQEYVEGKKRIVDFLAYPGNYGFIPQTKLLKKKGGDNDPIDVLLISESKKRGSVQAIKIIGALDFDDRGERDTKLLAVPKNEGLSHIDSLEEMFIEYPNLITIVKLWFQGYKGPQKMHFTGYITKGELHNIIENSHKDWKREVNVK